MKKYILCLSVMIDADNDNQAYEKSRDIEKELENINYIKMAKVETIEDMIISD